MKIDLALNVVAAISYAVGAACMKASDGLRSWVPAVFVYVCFSAGATLQAFAMRQQEIGVSNTIVLGIEAVGAVALGMIFFRETASLSKVCAIGLVGTGVYLLRR